MAPSGNYVTLPRNPYAWEGPDGWRRVINKLRRIYLNSLKHEEERYYQSTHPDTDQVLIIMSGYTQEDKQKFDDAMDVWNIYYKRIEKENHMMHANRHNT